MIEAGRGGGGEKREGNLDLNVPSSAHRNTPGMPCREEIVANYEGQIFQAASHLSSMVFVIWIFLQFILMPFMSGIIQFTLVIFIVSSRLFKIVTDTVGFHVAERHA